MLSVTPSSSREVALITNPEFEAGHAAGHRARRLVDGRDTAFSDPFLLMAEDWAPRDAFSRHPHRGIETVTLLLDGALEHYDSAGNTGVIRTGDAQSMTAGRGVIHNENPLPGTTAHALQLWVNLPASEKMTAPRYQDLKRAELPIRLEPGVEIRILSGSSGGVTSPTLNHVPVTAIDARVDDEAAFDQELAVGANAFLLVIEGTALVGPKEQPVLKDELAWLTRSEDSSRGRSPPSTCRELLAELLAALNSRKAPRVSRSVRLCLATSIGASLAAPPDGRPRALVAAAGRRRRDARSLPDHLSHRTLI